MRRVAGLILLAGLFHGLVAQASDPTAIRFIDGSVALSGAGPDGKALTVKVSYNDISLKPAPGQSQALRKELDLGKFSSPVQARLVELVNDLGYFAVGLDEKNAKAKQHYQVFDSRGNKIGEAGTYPLGK